MGNLSPKGEGRGEGKDILDLGVWVQKEMHPHPQAPLPKGEGRPDSYSLSSNRGPSHCPLLPLNAYGTGGRLGYGFLAYARAARA
jgi:hypothetical protein